MKNSKSLYWVFGILILFGASKETKGSPPKQEELTVINSYYFSHGEILSASESLLAYCEENQVPPDFLHAMVYGHLDQAEERYEKALERYSQANFLARSKLDSIQVLYASFNVAYTKLNDDSIAGVFAEKLFYAVPDTCNEFLAGYFSSVGDFDRANYCYQNCVQAFPRNSVYRLSLISNHLKMGNIKKGEEMITDFRTDFPGEHGVGGYLLTMLELELKACLGDHKGFLTQFNDSFEKQLQNYFPMDKQEALKLILEEMEGANKLVDHQFILRVMERNNELLSPSSISWGKVTLFILLFGLVVISSVLVYRRNRKREID